MKKKGYLLWNLSCSFVSILFAVAFIYTKRLLYFDNIFISLQRSGLMSI